MSTGPSAVVDLAGQRRQPLEVGGVGDERRRPLADLRRGLLEPLERATGDRDPGALARQRGGDPAPEPLAGAHHQRHPSLDALDPSPDPNDGEQCSNPLRG